MFGNRIQTIAGGDVRDLAGAGAVFRAGDLLQGSKVFRVKLSGVGTGAGGANICGPVALVRDTGAGAKTRVGIGPLIGLALNYCRWELDESYLYPGWATPAPTLGTAVLETRLTRA